ncbi:hypothetical protein [Streptomyces sp. AGS-58]|uniref:hypothetical protein n=1 Tax=unclassified Streptomyces TaxID=2593676 RepID=UPI0035A39734
MSTWARLVGGGDAGQDRGLSGRRAGPGGGGRVPQERDGTAVLLPLAEAWDSGTSTWTPAEREAYATTSMIPAT